MQYLEEEYLILLPTGSNRGYSYVDVSEGLRVNMIIGATRLAHLGTLWHLEIIQRKLD